LSAQPRGSALAPFKVRSFRFQWPADLCTSWAFEMETLILGWYVLVETRSVLMLTIYASMQHVGTLLAPMFGVMGDRVGMRNLLSAMRGFYCLLATVIMTLAFTGLLNPYLVLGVAALMGLVRPSDIGMRTALVGETLPPGQLMGAMSVQRTTQDSARITGALTGAGLVGWLGLGPAYTVVVCFYAISCLLTLQTGAARPLRAGPGKVTPPPDQPERSSPLRDLKEGLAYVWNTPYLRGTMILAFFINMTAFPLFNGLQPYVAKEIYGADQRTLSYMITCAASGALIGSIAMSRFNSYFRPSRLMVYAGISWYLILFAYSRIDTAPLGMVVIFFAGIAQATGLIPMATILLRNSDHKYRGRIMGVRMLAIYGNMPGILLAGYLIPRIGYPVLAAAYCVFGIVTMVAIVYWWRDTLWRGDAPANAR
jgi:Na+/melibiose symporter-like transporter